MIQVSEETVEIYVSNLRGRLNYETKKAAKLGFFTLHDYVRDKLTKETEALEQPLQVTPTKKQIKSKPIKKITAPASSCGCCP
ncbi:hypothetical protein N9427_03785 [Paracoccaceae bacterium]|nr:hypothetical protein [Paracoccaceae bacterium]